MYGWKWYLKDIRQDKDVSVFSTFSCGGGSSMGYKRAGFKVLGNVEIDPAIIKIYQRNLSPKHSYLSDLRDFNKRNDLPDELLDLDILDGSPPCSVFSTAGSRQKGWGVEKKFREGQKEQRLDDLFFVYLDTVEKLRPKVFVAENVTGLIKGAVRGYVNQILKKAASIGYEVQIFRLNAAFMEVPQYRERIFFIGNRMRYPKLKLEYSYKPIPFGQVRSESGKPISRNSLSYSRMQRARSTDNDFGDILKRETGRESNFNASIFHDKEVARTITAQGSLYRFSGRCKLSDEDIRACSTFPQDYDFMGSSVQYICGMSVPPSMMAHIASDIYRQWLCKEGLR